MAIVHNIVRVGRERERGRRGDTFPNYPPKYFFIGSK